MSQPWGGSCRKYRNINREILVFEEPYKIQGEIKHRHIDLSIDLSISYN